VGTTLWKRREVTHCWRSLCQKTEALNESAKPEPSVELTPKDTLNRFLDFRKLFFIF
jgi:hypothetical protein